MALEIPAKLIDKVGVVVSKEINKNVEKCARELRNSLETARAEKEIVKNNASFIEKFIDNINGQRNREVALERNPSKLCHDISKRLLSDKDSFGETVWKNADVSGRKAMLDKMLHVIGEEMELPMDIRQNMQLHIADLNEVEGATNLFVRLGAEDRIVLDKNTVPEITLHTHLLAPDANMLDALEVLFHESLHVMQQASVMETGDTVLNTSLKKLWDKEIREACRTRAANLANQSFEEYITSEMEAFPHAYDDYLIEVYHACETA